MNDVFDRHDAEFAKIGLNDLIVGQRKSLPVDFAISTLREGKLSFGVLVLATRLEDIP